MTSFHYKLCQLNSLCTLTGIDTWMQSHQGGEEKMSLDNDGETNNHELSFTNNMESNHFEGFNSPQYTNNDTQEGALSRLNTLRKRLVLKHPQEAKDNQHDSMNEATQRKPSNLLQNKSKFYLHKNSIERSNDIQDHNHVPSSNNFNHNIHEQQHNNNLRDIVHGYSDQLKDIRKFPIPKHKQQTKPFQPPLRRVAEGIPEVHFIGEIRKGLGFTHKYCSPFSFSSSSSISCKWKIEWGQSFSLLAGEMDGQTQYSLMDDDDSVCIWNHPIDVHFVAASMKGWPRIIIQLWELDTYGRTLLVGFGFAHFPCTKG